MTDKPTLHTTKADLASALVSIRDQVLDSRPLNAGTYRGFLIRLDAFGAWQAWKDESGPTFLAHTRSRLEFMIDEDELDDEETFGNPLPVTQAEQDFDDGRFDDCRYDGSPDALCDDALNGEED